MTQVLATLTAISIYFGWLVVLAGIVAVLEYRSPAGPQPAMSARVGNVLIVVFVLVLTAVLEKPVFTPVIARLDAHGFNGVVFGDWRPSTLPGYVASTLVFAFVWDFLQYWFHRAEHQFSPLWRMHALHHDEENMNSTTSQRTTFGSATLLFFCVYVPTVVICGTNLLSLIGAYLFFRVYGFFNHANVRLDLGRLTPIISGPQWHRLHHGRQAQYYNANFAAFFPFLDVAFGTYRRPEHDEYPATGLSDRPQARLGAAQLIKDVLSVSASPTKS